jgi:hypothetical protein
MPKVVSTKDPEIEAIAQVYAALSGLQPDAQQRVLDYVSRKLGLQPPARDDQEKESESDRATWAPIQSEDESSVEPDSDLAAINSVAKKWMQRSGLTVAKLSTIFSIGADEIDLVAKKVPGKTKRDRMRSVFLLKSVAAYLASGAARVSYEQVKEACLHYDAFDNANFAKYLKGMAAEISGTKQSGYSLTARGLVAATEVVKESLGEGAEA